VVNYFNNKWKHLKWTNFRHGLLDMDEILSEDAISNRNNGKLKDENC